MPKKRASKSHHPRKTAPRKPDVLHVPGIAALLGVSADTVYDLLASGQLPGRKVGRKWLTTRSAVMRWIEDSVAADTTHRATQRAINIGDKAALAKALQSGAVRVKAA